MAPAPVIRLNPDDSVVIARTTLLAGAEVAKGIAASEKIPAGHKVAVRAIAVGEPVKRYGQIIGFATKPIGAGQHVHIKNMGMDVLASRNRLGGKADNLAVALH